MTTTMTIAITAFTIYLLVLVFWRNYRNVYNDAYFDAKRSCFMGMELDELEVQAAASEVIPTRRGIRKAIVDIQHYGWNAQDTRDAFARSLDNYFEDCERCGKKQHWDETYSTCPCEDER